MTAIEIGAGGLEDTDHDAIMETVNDLSTQAIHKARKDDDLDENIILDPVENTVASNMLRLELDQANATIAEQAEALAEKDEALAEAEREKAEQARIIAELNKRLGEQE